MSSVLKDASADDTNLNIIKGTHAMEDRMREETIEQIERLSKDRIGISTLERYTGSKASEFQPYVLLTNFKAYVDNFGKLTGNPLRQGSVMRAAHCPIRRISTVDFSVGSPVAALVVELLSFLKPRAILMLGMCGGLMKEHEVGDFFNPVAAIREEGTSNAYMPP
jgi:AMP nucleosidase